MPLNKIIHRDRPRIGAPAPDSVPLRATRSRTVPLAPLGVYAEIPAVKADDAPVVELLRETKAEDRWREAFDALLAGEPVKLSREDLGALQMVALDTVLRTFDGKHNDDSWLRHAVNEKRGPLEQYKLPDDLSRAVLAGRPLIDKQADAISFLLRTFLGREGADANLRHAIYDKLEKMGRRRDIAAIIPHVRRGQDVDLFYGLKAINAITARRGSPQVRGGLARHPVVGPLLTKDDLTEHERFLLVEMVLKHGQVKSVEKLHDGAHFNPVFFVTFEETEPTPNGRRPIRGVFKPETTWPGKSASYFSREVSAYEFDRSFARTGLVPPTVEAILQLDGREGCDLGSLQYMIPEAKPLGYRVREDGEERWHYQPEFEHLRGDPAFSIQMSRARTILYVLGDPDKLESNVKPLPNLANFMVSDGRRLWLIDNAYSQGAAPKPDRHILPQQHDGTVQDNLREALETEGPEWIHGTLATFIEDHDASEVSRRTRVATEELDRRKRI